jgi:antitoxin (DNA-binding transcriptional repressor) of toxin-antitoxin stability system
MIEGRGRVTIVTENGIIDAMKTVTIRDFRTRPRQVRETLQREREAVLTVNGRPVAVMIPVDAGSLDGAVETLRRARALEAVRAIRSDAQRRGQGPMSSAAIEKVIAKTRRARARRAAG